jgi:anti-sigma regulatory factor (Ser/Thr protein kinase)
MAADRTLIDLDLPAVPASATVARRAVAEALREVAVDRDAVVVMVSEAVANSAAHAYPDAAAVGRVRVHAELIDDEALAVVVSDDGVGMAAHAESSGFGIGVPLMGDVADGVEVAAGGGTRVSGRFELFGPAGPHGRRVPREPLGGRARRRLARLLRLGR